MKYDKEIVVKFFAEHGLIALAEFPFHASRRWRFDFVLGQGECEQTIALEVEGGIWVQGGGRHNRGAGMKADMEKYNEAAALGWRIIRVTPDQLCMESTIELIKRALNVG